jgi:hypothetical protein
VVVVLAEFMAAVVSERTSTRCLWRGTLILSALLFFEVDAVDAAADEAAAASVVDDRNNNITTDVDLIITLL